MTEKRFTYMEQFNGFCDVYDNGKILSCMRLEYVENTINLLNKLHEENEQLKQQLNYIQNSISEHIKHQKTELGQKALKEIIVDYNEWMLGHKEVYE